MSELNTQTQSEHREDDSVDPARDVKIKISEEVLVAGDGEQEFVSEESADELTTGNEEEGELIIENPDILVWFVCTSHSLNVYQYH